MTLLESHHFLVRNVLLGGGVCASQIKFSPEIRMFESMLTYLSYVIRPFSTPQGATYALSLASRVLCTRGSHVSLASHPHRRDSALSETFPLRDHSSRTPAALYTVRRYSYVKNYVPTCLCLRACAYVPACPRASKKIFQKMIFWKPVWNPISNHHPRISLKRVFSSGSGSDFFCYYSYI